MDYIEKIKIVLEEKGFVSNPFDLIYDTFSEIDDIKLESCLYEIAKHNNSIIEEKEKSISKLQETITFTEPQTQKLIEEKVEYESTTEIKIEYKDLKNKIKMLISSSDEDLLKNIDSINKTDLPRIKLLIYKEIIDITKKIKEMILYDETKDIHPLQEKLKRYNKIFNAIKVTLIVESQDENTSEKIEEKELILVPTEKGTSYFEEDLLDNIGQKNKIKNAYYKLMRGIFVNNTKPIYGKSEKMMEYYNKKTGIRVFYIVLSENKYAIVGILFKDKQTSTRLEQEYDNCISRFQARKEYILSNLENPAFYESQEELHGRIESIIQTGKKLQLSKKDGE